MFRYYSIRTNVDDNVPQISNGVSGTVESRPSAVNRPCQLWLAMII